MSYNNNINSGYDSNIEPSDSDNDNGADGNGNGDDNSDNNNINSKYCCICGGGFKDSMGLYSRQGATFYDRCAPFHRHTHENCRLCDRPCMP